MILLLAVRFSHMNTELGLEIIFHILKVSATAVGLSRRGEIILSHRFFIDRAMKKIHIPTFPFHLKDKDNMFLHSEFFLYLPSNTFVGITAHLPKANTLLYEGTPSG